MNALGYLLIGGALTVALYYFLQCVIPTKPPRWFYGDDEDE